MSNLYLEFDQIVRKFGDENIHYAVVGGLAVGFYGYLRSTEDIDFLVDTQDVNHVSKILDQFGYHDKKEPWRFKGNQLLLRRFIKLSENPVEISVVDILEADNSGSLTMLNNAVEVKYSEILIRVAKSSDLILMKKSRNSDKDKHDISYLEGLLENENDN